ncbi:MAG: ABC transporter ATP-binding protein, partial [Burkholderiaceae bacterium]|nr:ABC transporter ATP-binding protein [Burkholderiaceae bacterium]
MAKVSIKNVSKAYPGERGIEVAPVDDISLDIQDRECVVLAGPSGCGNSTLLRMVAGLEKIARGDVFIGDHRVNDVPPKDRNVAMLFQNDALYPDMSIYENMAFGLKRRNFSTTEIKKRVMDAAALLGLSAPLEHKPNGLSAEQRQRAALARAIAHQPKVFLFDEPLLNLETATRARMRTEIVRLHQRLETTMIYVTRDPAEAMMMGQRLIVLSNGVVQQDDMPLALYNSPANLSVAGFLGSPSMNLIHGTLKQERDSLLFSEREGGTIIARIPLSKRPALKEFLGKPVVLGIRPEDIEVAQSPSRQGLAPNIFPG